MKQVFRGNLGIGNLATSSTNFLHPLGFQTAAPTTAAQSEVPAAVAGTLSKLAVNLSVAPGSGKSRLFEVLVNGASTGITLTISDLATSGSDLSNSVAVVAGDLVTLRTIPTGTPAASLVRWSFEADWTTPGESWYGGSAANSSLSTAAARSVGPLSGCGFTSSATLLGDVLAIDGTIDEIRLVMSVAPGVGKLWTFELLVNGASVDSTTISDLATSATFSPAAAVVAGDYVELRVTPTGTPASSTVKFGTKFLPATDGQFQWTTHMITSTAGAGTFNFPPPWATAGGTSWNVTEANFQAVYPGPTPLTLFSVAERYATATGTVGAINGWTYNARVNGATAISNMIDGLSIVNVTAGSAAIASGDLLGIGVVSNGGSPSTKTASHAWGLRAGFNPILTGSGGTLAYVEDDPATIIDGGITVTDVDSANMSGAEISVTANYDSGEDELTFADQLGITGSWNSGTGVLTLSGSAAASAYQTALRAVKYVNNEAVAPGTSTRTVSFVVTDSDGLDSLAVTRDISVSLRNDPPIVTAPAGTVAYTEGDAATVLDVGITVADEDDANLEWATVQITGNYSRGEDVLACAPAFSIATAWNEATGTLTLTGTDTLANYQTTLRTVTYVNTRDGVPVSQLPRTITITVSDS